MSSIAAPAVCVVTGANSGIGRATAVHLAAQGYTVYGTVRSLSKATKLNAMAAAAGVKVPLVELDVADDESVRAGFARLLDLTGGVIDVLVNNAGVGGNAVAEECTPALYLDVMNINLCGPARCWQQVLPGMRARGRGAIVNITSVTGRIGALAQSPYVASFGVRVAIIEPGVTKTAIFAKNIDTPHRTGAYDDAYRRMFQMYAAGLAHATDPMEVGKVVHAAISAERAVLRHTVSWGGDELVHGRAAMTDEQWVALGHATGDDAYYDAFQAAFGLDLRDVG